MSALISFSNLQIGLFLELATTVLFIKKFKYPYLLYFTLSEQKTNIHIF